MSIKRDKNGRFILGSSGPFKGKKRINMTGIKHPMYGKTHTKEARKRISLSKIGKTTWNKGKKMPHAKNNPQVFKKGMTPWNKGKKYEAITGEKHFAWKGGLNFKTRIRTLLEYKQWREHIFQRDDYTCQNCKKRGCELNADHIIPFSAILQMYNIKTLEDACKCEFLWDIRNGRTLCVPCHKDTDTFLWKAKQYERTRKN